MEYRTYPLEEHATRVACGDPQALAYEWLHAYTKNVSQMAEARGYAPITFDELMRTAASAESGWGEVIIRGGVFEGFNVDDTFWEKFQILSGKKIPEVNRYIFSCSC